MNRKTRIEKDYKLIMAGKERIIPYVQLTESRFGGKFLISNDEFQRISFIVSNQVCSSKDLLTLDELEFLRSTFRLTQSEVAAAIEINESTISKWKNTKKVSGLDMIESFTLKNYFRTKLVERTGDVGQSKLLIDLIVNEIRDNFLQNGGINPETFREIQDIVLSKLVCTEFDVPSASFEEKLSVEDFEMDVSSYLDGISTDEEINYNDDYLASLSVAV